MELHGYMKHPFKLIWGKIYDLFPIILAGNSETVLSAHVLRMILKTSTTS